MSKSLVTLAVALALGLAGSTQAALISGVSIQDFSSQLTENYNRAAIYTVTAPGLNFSGPNTYSNNPDGTMWLNSGNGCCGGFSNTGTVSSPNSDTNPQITWNLGGLYDVANMRVWNYNEVNLTARGIQTTHVFVSQNGITYTDLGQVTLNQAPGTTNVDFSQVLPLNVDAHYVRFGNMTSWGGDNNFFGLSAIQFNGVAVPEPSSLILCGLGAVSLFAAARRRKT